MRGAGSIWAARAEPRKGSAQGQCWFRNVGGSEPGHSCCGSSWSESRLGMVGRGLFRVCIVNQLLALPQPWQASLWVSLDSSNVLQDDWVRFSWVGKKQTPSHPVTSLWCQTPGMSGVSGPLLLSRSISYSFSPLTTTPHSEERI